MTEAILVKSLVEAQIKRTRAVELAAQGHSYDQIAHEVSYRHRGSAYRAVHKALAENEAEAVHFLRQLEMVRLSDLQRALWPKAMAGDFGAANLVLRVIDLRIRLLCLDKKTKGTEAEASSVLVQPGIMSHQAEGNPGRRQEMETPRAEGDPSYLGMVDPR